MQKMESSFDVAAKHDIYLLGLLGRLQQTTFGSAIVAQHQYKIKAIECDVPALILPLQGVKRLHANGHTWTCQPGEYVMLHQALSAQVENIPEHAAPYRAWMVCFPWRLIALARQLLAQGLAVQPNTDSRQCISHGIPALTLVQAINRYGDVQQASAEVQNPAEIDLSLLGILVALHAGGDAGFLFAEDPSLSARIRILVSSAPMREWSSADFEAEFHVSGATLRRRLASEGSSLRVLIRQARLHAALSLLQTSKKSVKSVALQCGYRSVASFRENFVEQFGTEPKLIAST